MHKAEGTLASLPADIRNPRLALSISAQTHATGVFGFHGHSDFYQWSSTTNTTLNFYWSPYVRFQSRVLEEW